MTDTQPFMDEARKLLDSLGACNCVECTEDVATALSSAYQRGKEEEREDAARKAVTRLAELQIGYEDAMQVAAAIRSTN